jgi:glycosyltransferase 2 family protein
VTGSHSSPGSANLPDPSSSAQPRGLSRLPLPARLALSACVAALLLGGLALWGDLGLEDLAQAWRRLSATTLLLAVAVHASIYLVRSQRFRVLIPKEHRPSSAAMLAISAAHNLAAYVLPAKTGELSLVVYLKGHSQVPAGTGLAALLVSRLLDLATLAFSLALASLWLVFQKPEVAPRWMLPCAALLLIAASALMALSARSDRLVALLERLARWLQFHRVPLGRRALEQTNSLAAALREAGSGRRLWIAAGLSLAMWLGIFVFYGILARGFGLSEQLGLAEAAFGSSLAVLTNLLPINAFAGFGTQEGGWVLGFGLLGVARDLALSTGLGVHLVQLASTCLFGLLGHLAMGLLPHRAPAPSSASASSDAASETRRSAVR